MKRHAKDGNVNMYARLTAIERNTLVSFLKIVKLQLLRSLEIKPSPY